MQLVIDADGRVAVRTVDDVADRVGALRGAVDETATSTGGLAGNLIKIGATVFAVDRLVAAVREFAQTNIEAQSQALALESISASAEKAAQDLGWLAEVADRQGVALGPITDQWISLAASVKGTALEGAPARDVMAAISAAMALLGRTGPEASQALTAVSQMAAKGVVSMEELRGQLGEALPGALQAMAKGLGLSVGELNALVESGRLTAEQALPALAAGLRETFGLDAQARVEGLGASINRLSNELRALQTEMGDSGALAGLTAMTDLAAELVSAADGAAILDAGLVALAGGLAYAAGQAGRMVAASAASSAAAKAHSETVVWQARNVEYLAQRQQVGASAALTLARAEQAAAQAALQHAAAAASAGAATAASAQAQVVAAQQALTVARQREATAAQQVAVEQALAERVRAGSAGWTAYQRALERASAAQQRHVVATAAATAAEQALAQVRARAESGIAVTQEQALAAARARSRAATVANLEAESAYRASLQQTAAAQAAASAAAASTGLTWRSLTSATTLLSAGMTTLIGLEVGRWLRGVAEDSEIGRAAFAALDDALGSLSETYRGQIEAERQLAASRERGAELARRIADATGLQLTSIEQVNAAIARGALVWDAAANAWVRGVEVTETLTRALQSLDAQLSGAGRQIDTLAKSQDALAKAAVAAAQAAAQTARALGDEEGALRATAEARALAAAAADQALATARAQLDLSEQALAAKVAETAADGAAREAQQARIGALTEEVTQRRAAVAAAEAQVAASAAEVTAARLAADTYGDQSARARELVGVRNEMEAQVSRLTRESENLAVTQDRLATAQDHARTVAEAYHSVLTGVADGDLAALADAYRDAQATVDDLTAAVARGQAAEADLPAQRRALAEATARAADATRDLAAARQAEMAAAERAISLLRQEIEMRVERLRNLAEEARVRGDLAQAAQLEEDAARAHRAGLRESATALKAAAVAAREYAEALRLAAEADGEITLQERAALEAAQDTARAKQMQADAAAEAARHARSLADAEQQGATAAERAADATARRADESERAARAARDEAAAAERKRAAEEWANAPRSATDWEAALAAAGGDAGQVRESLRTQGASARSLYAQQAMTREFEAYLAAQRQGQTQPAAAGGTMGTSVTINIAGVLDVSDRATLESLGRKLAPVLGDLTRRGA